MSAPGSDDSTHDERLMSASDAGSADTGLAPSATAGGGRYGLITATACSATFLSILDAAVVNLAFGPIAAELPASAGVLTWIVSAYAVTFAAWLAVAGRLSDALGHRGVLVAGIVGFAVASGVCATAPSAGVLIGARAVQGVAAALLLPAALGALLAATPAQRRGSAIGAWAATGALAAAIGPAVGALLVQAWGWRAIFALNLPVCAVLFTMALVAVPGRGRARGEVPDLWGAVLLSGGIAAVVAAVSEGRSWPGPLTWMILLIGLFAIGVVILRSFVHPQPAVEVELWRQRRFAAASAVAFFLGVGLFGYLLSVPLLFTGPWGLSLLGAAGCVGSAGLAAMVAATVAGQVVTEANARWCCAGGMLAITAGFGVLSSEVFGAGRAWGAWAVVALLLGAGMGCAITALSVITAQAAGANGYVAAFGANTTARQIGGAVGIAILAAVLTSSVFLGDFHVLFAILTGAALVGAVLAAALLGEGRAAAAVAGAPDERSASW